MECELIHVAVTDMDDNQIRLVIPAYTPGFNVVEKRIHELTSEYLEKSRRTANPVSLGDFALFLLSAASDDPREIPGYSEKV